MYLLYTHNSRYITAIYNAICNCLCILPLLIKQCNHFKLYSTNYGSSSSLPDNMKGLIIITKYTPTATNSTTTKEITYLHWKKWHNNHHWYYKLQIICSTLYSPSFLDTWSVLLSCHPTPLMIYVLSLKSQ